MVSLAAPLGFFLGSLQAKDAPKPPSVTYAEATEIFVALNNLQSGFSATNTGILADDLNALLPHVKAFDAVKATAQKKLNALANDKDRDAKAQPVVAEIEAFGAREIPGVILTPLVISDDEITAAHLSPAQLAIIRRDLSAPKK